LVSFDRRYLVVALICGVASALALFSYLQRMEKKVTATSRYTQIVVASRELPIRSRLKKEDLRLVRIPRSAKEDGDLISLEEAVGRIITVKLLQGQRLKKEHLLPQGQLAGLSHEVPPLWRAVTICADDMNSLCGMLQPGDRVDLLMTTQDESESLVLAADRQVLAVGQQTGLQKGDQESKSNTITLLVKPQEAQRIALAEERGRIRIALRPLEGEKEPPMTPPKKVARRPSPAPAPKPQPQPEVIPEFEPEPLEAILVIHGSKLQEIWP
jgi:pilus assembly protein CpaB